VRKGGICIPGARRYASCDRKDTQIKSTNQPTQVLTGGPAIPIRKLLADAAARSVNKCANRPSASMARSSLVLSNNVMARDSANLRCSGSVPSHNNFPAISRVLSFKAGIVTALLVAMVPVAALGRPTQERTAVIVRGLATQLRARKLRATRKLDGVWIKFILLSSG